MTRILLLGPTGSGKSTLAARLGAHFGVPVRPLDEMHWVRDPAGDRRRDPHDRALLLEQAVRAPGWVIEGVQLKWADAAIDRADLVLVLDPARRSVRFRILRRFLRRRLRGPRGTPRALREKFGWAADWFRFERRLLLERLASLDVERVLFHPG